MVKKVSEYGIHDSIGKTLEFMYGFEVTQVTDNTGMCNTYTFNEYGNTESISNLGIGQNITECFGRNRVYGTSNYNFNKLLSESEKIKTINNLIWNSSFEKNYNIFTGNDTLEISITDEFCLDGNRSLKMSGYGNAWATIPIHEAGSYTFSFYCKSYNEFEIFLRSGSETSKTLSIEPSIEFQRYEITIDNVQEQSNVDICIYIGGMLSNNVYFDNIQLEKGKAANSYNFIDNNDFRYNMAGWIYDGNNNNSIVESTFNDIIDFKTIGNRTDEIITYEDGTKAFKMICDPTINRCIERFIDVSGQIGDTLYFSFWYKNSGLKQREDFPEFRNNTIQFVEWPSNEQDAGDANFVYANLNSNSDEWQYYSCVIKTRYNYNKFRFIIMSICSANELYITNFNLIKLDGLLYNKYDENGNIIATYDKSNNESVFKYDKNNQLIKMTNPIGNSLNYEYDNNYVTRILSGISPNGITNSIKYDSNKNPIVTRTENKTKVDLENGIYYIRAKGTNKYLKYDCENKQLILEESACSHAKWIITKTDNKIRIESVLNNLVYVDQKVVSTLEFVHKKQDNNSYTLESDEKFLTISNNQILLSSIVDLPNQQFYFENIETLFIENSAKYSSDGRFLLSTTDSLFNTVSYNINENNGLINSFTNQNGIITNYSYNSKNQLSSMSKGDLLVEYNYNGNNMLSKIILANKIFTLNYDEFLNLKSFYINNYKILENYYSNNNTNLSHVVYGNGNTINYEYDQFGRISKTIKMDDTYNYYYDNFGNLKIVDSNNGYNVFDYDLAQRLIELKIDDNYKIHYNYNKLNNIESRKVSFGDADYNYTYEYNEESNPTKLTIGNVIINYLYDELQRLKQISFGNSNIIYNYLTNGKRTSFLVDNFFNGIDNYKFKYDKLGNITKIYKNDILMKKYYYDIHSQLIREENSDGSIIYVYDNFGNIVSKTKYDLNNVLISTDLYEYGNIDFKDQLTKYNNCVITYDNIGNPLTIGNDTLTWKNGRQLTSYSKNDLIVSYKYNDAGVRIEKKVNNLTYKYYLERKNINCIQISENVLYFIRGVDDKLIGFKYNDDLYYYIKNIQDDIIGIKDSNSNIVVIYEYDTFGKILSIKDNSGNNVTDSNHIANINPFRYRSYYYDSETGLYYLNSRYYNPEWGRFINLDGIIGANNDLLSFNLYSYCSNNFVNCVDYDGEILVFLAKRLWKSVVYCLNIIGMNTSAEFLNKSIDGKAKYAIYGSSSRVAKQIKEDSAFKTEINRLVADADNQYIKNSSKISFENNDLKGSLNKATLNVKGNLVNGCEPLDVEVYDFYDFGWRKDYFDGDFKNFVFIVGNNLADIDENFGIINNYDIYIFFKYDPCS